MIQRIQTVYLLLTTFIAILFLSGDIIFFTNGTALTLLGISGQTGTDVAHKWFFTALLLVIPVLSFLIIFLYKKRKLQIRLTVLLIFLVAVMIAVLGYYYYVLTGNSDAELTFSYKLFLPLLMLIFSILALTGIRKDENIVRSYDRLR